MFTEINLRQGGNRMTELAAVSKYKQTKQATTSIAKICILKSLLIYMYDLVI